MSTPATLALDRGAPPWLFAVALAATAPHALHQPLWLTAMAGLLWFWGTWIWWKDQRLPSRWLLLLLVAVACAGTLVEFRTLFGRDAGVGMLVLFTSMKLLEMRSQRDASVLLTLGYFLLLTHYLYSQSIVTGVWLLFAFWLVTAATIRLQGGAEIRLRPTLRYAAVLSLQALPFMLALFILFPRVGGPLWGLPQDAHAGRTGLSDSMSPGSLSQLAQSGEIAFRARFDGQAPARDKLYWRGPVLENYDGKTWQPAAARAPAERLETLTQTISYETTIEAHNQRWLLALDAPVGLPPEATLNGNLTALSRRPLEQRQRYRLAASLDYRFNVEETPYVLQHNLTLPPQRNPRSLALGRQWRAEATDPTAVVNRALKQFRDEEFVYTLQPPLLGDNPIDDFLFSTRRGFCEHYAAAFVVLMRAAGIPARVVTGYQGGEANPLDGYLVVRQSDAHAWAEVWLAGRGWVRVDPTAAIAPNRIEQGIADALPAGEPLPALVQIRADWLRLARYRWEALNNAWNQYVLGYDGKRQRDLLDRLGLPDADWRSLAALLAGVCGALLAAVALWVLYRRPQLDPAQRLWRKALRHLARRQVDFAPWEAPMHLAQRIADERPDMAEAFARVAEAYLLARYGGAEEQIKRLRRLVAQLP